MEAFFDRGIQDLYASHDLEDILYIFNYTTEPRWTDSCTRDRLFERIGWMNDERYQNPRSNAGPIVLRTVDECLEIILGKMKRMVKAG